MLDPPHDKQHPQCSAYVGPYNSRFDEVFVCNRGGIRCAGMHALACSCLVAVWSLASWVSVRVRAALSAALCVWHAAHTAGLRQARGGRRCRCCARTPRHRCGWLTWTAGARTSQWRTRVSLARDCVLSFFLVCVFFWNCARGPSRAVQHACMCCIRLNGDRLGVCAAQMGLADQVQVVEAVVDPEAAVIPGGPPEGYDLITATCAVSKESYAAGYTGCCARYRPMSRCWSVVGLRSGWTVATRRVPDVDTVVLPRTHRFE
eukprot:COSAG01_NODE_1418_length_10375_cov_38.842254_12_plen_261_part_00